MNKNLLTDCEKFFADFSEYEKDNTKILNELRALNPRYSFSFDEGDTSTILTDAIPYNLKLPKGFYLAWRYIVNKNIMFLTNRQNTRSSIGNRKRHTLTIPKLEDEISYKLVRV